MKEINKEDDVFSPLHPDYPCLIRFRGHIYRCVTSAYLAQNLSVTKQYMFENLNATRARETLSTLGVEQTSDRSVLLEIQKAKFDQHPRLQTLLKEYVSKPTMNPYTETLLKVKRMYVADEKRLQLGIHNVAIVGEEYDENLDMQDYFDMFLNIKNIINTLLKLGATKFLHTVHTGTEQIAFWSANAQSQNKDVLHLLYLPYPCQLMNNEDDPIFGLDDWEKICQAANGVRYATPIEKENSFQLIDEKLINDCDTLLVVVRHNCKIPERVNNLIGNARALGKRVIHFDPLICSQWCNTQADFKQFRLINNLMDIFSDFE